MKRRTSFSWKTIIIACFLSCLVTEIDSVQDDTDKQPMLPSQNHSALYEYEEKSDLKSENDPNTVGYDNFISNVDVKENIVGVLAEITSKNAGALNDLTTEGATIVVSLPETATSDLKAEVEKLSTTIKSSQDNQDNNTSGVLEPTPEVVIVDHKIDDVEDIKNDTNVPLNETKDTSEEIPSFSEWAQKRLEEAEKNFVNESGNMGTNGKSGSGVKLGWKNYASPDCGAKVVAANPEAVSASSVISPSREEYKLNVCTNRIWFIVELCEAIQAKKIDIANFELFSSTPKEFTVSIGDRFPNRDWTTVGQFTAKDERDVQSFDLNPHLFGRYIRVEVKSHHGSQHYCPISLFRVYGISELEVLQKEELAHGDDEDMEDNDEALIYSDGLTKNMLNSATNAVYSMIKKAAEVLGTKSNKTDYKKDGAVQFEYSPLINTCSTPSHNIICSNCSDLLFGQVYELLSCKSTHIGRLVNLPYIYNSLINSPICRSFGLVLIRMNDRSLYNKSFQYIQSLFPDKILAAMCNSIAVSENKAVLNNSQQFPNTTKSSDMENINMGLGIPKIAAGIEQSIKIDLPENSSENRPTDELKLDLTSKIDLPKVTCSTSLEYSSQIKPTKTVTLDVSIESSNMLSGSETEELTNHVTKGDTPPSEVNSNADAKVPGSDIEEAQEVADTNGHHMDVGNEPAESIDHIENFMTDIGVETGPSTVPPVAPGSNSVDRQKESVFLRLSNKIKALERNVSLSSQYLEELSRRYKKQVEEMQKLEKTIQSMLEERKKINEKSKQLEERLDDLVTTLEKWPGFFFWFLTTVTVFCGFCWTCGGERQRSRIATTEVIERRKSLDMITNKNKKKFRRPSDQALKIVRSSLIAEERKLSLEKRRRKRSNMNVKRSASINELDINGYREDNRDMLQDSIHGVDLNVPSQPGDWVEENSRLIEVIPLDESENSSLEQFGTILEQDVPHFAKTAVDRRAHRISSQHMKPNINGDQDFPYSVPRKNDNLENSPKMVEDDGRRSSLNGKLEEGNRKKEKRSFRSVLKNVFT